MKNLLKLIIKYKDQLIITSLVVLVASFAIPHLIGRHKANQIDTELLITLSIEDLDVNRGRYTYNKVVDDSLYTIDGLVEIYTGDNITEFGKTGQFLAFESERGYRFAVYDTLRIRIIIIEELEYTHAFTLCRVYDNRNNVCVETYTINGVEHRLEDLFVIIGNDIEHYDAGEFNEDGGE